MSHPPFAIVPLEVAMDDRLSKIQIRVLLAILSFRNKDTNLCWPKRKTICQRCGYSPATVSRATTALMEYGWLQKEGKGGQSKAVKYRLTVPELETVPEPDTVSAQTVPEPDTKRCPNRSHAKNRPVTDHKEEQTNGRNATHFDRFWDAYQKKVKRKQALAIWKRKKLDRKADVLIEDVERRHARDGRWKDGFQPDPTTYLNGERWEDDLLTPKSNGSGMPTDPGQVEAWARAHGKPLPKAGESMRAYRERVSH